MRAGSGTGMRMRGVDNIRFSPDLHAIMWISTKGVLREDERKILEIANDSGYLKEKKTIFSGYCFGRFDLIIEFKDTSARVASNVLCELQDAIAARGYPICSSLSLGAKVIGDDEKDDKLPKKPIRIYTFLIPKVNGVPLKNSLDILNKLDSEMKDSEAELYWTASSYSFLLTVSGDSFHNMFSKVSEFRDLTEDYFSDSCSYVGLEWEGEENKVEGDTIKALTFVKLSSGYGELELKPEDILLGWNKRTMSKRLGWSDISLEISKPTLREIKEAILDLRKNHKEEGDILSTSTLLLPQV